MLSEINVTTTDCRQQPGQLKSKTIDSTSGEIFVLAQDDSEGFKAYALLYITGENSSDKGSTDVVELRAIASLQ